MILRGRPVSPGYFEGRARVLDSRIWLEAALAVPPRSDAAEEFERLGTARDEARLQLERFESQLVRQGRRGDGEIFATHRALLNDIALERPIRSRLAEGRSAEAALAETIRALHEEFSQHASAMVRDKAPDLLDIGHRWLRCLDPEVEVRSLDGAPVVLIAASLNPSDLVSFAASGSCAALVGECAAKSHAAILARSLGIPLLSGLESPPGAIAEGDLVWIDGELGLAVVQPTEDEESEVERIRRAMAVSARPRPAPRQPLTRDGTSVRLRLNISDASEAALVGELGAAGIGLFRTEFFYMTRNGWPTEDESLAMYLAVAEAVGRGSLQIRLADFGADKCPTYANFPRGRNPSLGLRGIRLLLEHEEILAPQVRAIGRLAEERSVVLLVPMLDGLDTLERLIETLGRILGGPAERFPFELGAMIEVPAAALSIQAILGCVDRVSIGLNDLTQYLMAADREDETVERYHDPLAPAVLRVVRDVVRATLECGKRVSVCGELAGDPSLTAVLLALGVRDLSVSRADYERAAETIEGLSLPELSHYAERILAARSAHEVRALLAGH